MSNGNYSLLAHTEEFLVRPRIQTTREPHLYPSEASVKFTNEDNIQQVLGTCMRAAYLRFTGQEGEPTNARSELIYKMGDMVEAVLIETWKQMGIWVADGTEFYNNNYNIKGRLDVICKDPNGILYGAEVKSFYGYNAQVHIMGNRSKVGRPKDDQLLQTTVYANEFRNQLPYFMMFYLERGNAMRNEFKVEIRPVNGEDRLFVNNIMEERFKISDIYNRYTELTDYINRKEVPPPEFKLYYSNDEVEYHYIKGNVSKTNYTKFKRNPDRYRPGDWQCSYCDFQKYCWRG